MKTKDGGHAPLTREAVAAYAEMIRGLTTDLMAPTRDAERIRVDVWVPFGTPLPEDTPAMEWLVVWQPTRSWLVGQAVDSWVGPLAGCGLSMDLCGHAVPILFPHCLACGADWPAADGACPACGGEDAAPYLSGNLCADCAAALDAIQDANPLEPSEDFDLGGPTPEDLRTASDALDALESEDLRALYEEGK